MRRLKKSKNQIRINSKVTDEMEPVEIDVSNQNGKETITISWSDGHRSLYDPLELRISCPCAVCQGEPGIFGKQYFSAKEEVRKDVIPQEITTVGRYALKIEWSDGHNLGIYTFDYLRKLCSCTDCKKTSTLRT
jgi:DUF971 family protein